MYLGNMVWSGKTLRVALFITVKRWKQPNCPSTGKWIKQNMQYTCNGILLSLKKQVNYDTCYSTDEL